MTMFSYLDQRLHGLIDASVPWSMHWHVWRWLHWLVHELAFIFRQ